jgi:hypothetical protein
LLQYSCDLQTSVMPVAPMQITLPSSSDPQQQQQQQHPEVLDVLLNGKPLMCLAFSDMVVSVVSVPGGLGGMLAHDISA